MASLHYRAGPEALELLRREGLHPDNLAVVVGTATGPRWLALAGLDRALVASGLLEGRSPPLLVGGSAGGWRSLALASPDPARKHAELAAAYIEQAFPRRVPPAEVSASYGRMLDRLFGGEVLDALLQAEGPSVGLHACRARLGMGSRRRPLQLLAFVAAALATRVAKGTLDRLLDRHLYHSGESDQLSPEIVGARRQLTADNFLPAALATGTVPLYMEPVHSVHLDPRGPYIDGGMADYHLRDRYRPPGAGLTLLFHYQSGLRPTWFDKRRPGRRPMDRALAPLLLIYPDGDWIAELPAGRLPDRRDFLDHADRPQVRQERWRAANARSDELGEIFLDDLRSGRLVDLLEPL